jgi:ribosome biogenesis GTPase A
MATCHPQLQGWVSGKPLLLVLNRVDMVSAADQAAWAAYFRRQQQPTFWTDAKLGTGVRKVTIWRRVLHWAIVVLFADGVTLLDLTSLK